jgi:hypothetical protein
VYLGKIGGIEDRGIDAWSGIQVPLKAVIRDSPVLLDLWLYVLYIYIYIY